MSCHVISCSQDLYIPVSRAPELLAHVRAHVPLSTPLWLCPVRGPAGGVQPLAPHSGTTVPQLYLNVGVYGRVPDLSARQHTRALEVLCGQLGGRKMLYGLNLYSKEEFWSTPEQGGYDWAEFQRLRQTYWATGRFPDLYAKVCGDEPAGEGARPSWCEWLMDLWL